MKNSFDDIFKIKKDDDIDIFEDYSQEIAESERDSQKLAETLREQFLFMPFTVLDAKDTWWRARKKKWNKLGLKSGLGRPTNVFAKGNKENKFMQEINDGISIYDPVLCELLYLWFAKDNSKILDPFCGGSVRGYVASMLGHSYVGHDAREVQVLENIRQFKENLVKKEGVLTPQWIAGDSAIMLDLHSNESFDFVQTCPPYPFVEYYAGDKGVDISMYDTYSKFYNHYALIIEKSINKLKKGGIYALVVGDGRDKKGNYLGFVADNIKLFQSLGCSLYNDAIYISEYGNYPARASRQFRATRKLANNKQHVLIFIKGSDSHFKHLFKKFNDVFSKSDSHSLIFKR